MEDEPGGASSESRPPVGFRRATDWIAVAIVGALLLAIGIYKPATRWIRVPEYYGTDWVAVGIALVGGVLFGIGLVKWYDNRPTGPASRRRPPTRVDTTRATNLSSFQVYRPPEDDAAGSNKTKV
ncbi:MAG: TMEM198/TM7SF3 family protein [Thermoplasmata archaeon]|nr:TMEM198/TM7SF3 family protein [Thermoplasmata archaeon]MCI4359200.1 TMEM198/TM7SF3 family protein [Thermoplasmata archaeon]